jgi:hypothetical protein
MGGRRLEALALLGLGITRLSITPAAVGPIKELIRQVDLGEIRAAMDDWLAHPPADMRRPWPTGPVRTASIATEPARAAVRGSCRTAKWLTFAQLQRSLLTDSPCQKPFGQWLDHGLTFGLQVRSVA